jgi:hypothetical protein
MIYDYLGDFMKVKFGYKFREKNRARYENALRFYLDKLGVTEKDLKGVEVTIFLRKSKDRGCCQHDEGVRKPKLFDIIISPGGPVSPLQTLAHETVHLKQFVLGELRMLSKCNKWKGKVWKSDGTDLDDYYDSPWEIEAFGKEQGLYVRFLNEEN